MTAMPIDNHPLTQRRLQFIGISVNKLTLKSISIIQSSNNYNIVSSFICWNQNIVHIKIVDTSLKILKRRFRFPIGILSQVWYLIISIPDLCTLTYLGGKRCVLRE